MGDNLTKEQRHKNMSHIRSKDTKPEMIVRKYLFSRGLRYRLHVAALPGKPDLVFPKYKTVLFVQGCFWHAHSNCRYAKLPESNQSYWSKKFDRNIRRDNEVKQALESLGWKVYYIWECQLRAEMGISLQLLYTRIVGPE